VLWVFSELKGVGESGLSPFILAATGPAGAVGKPLYAKDLPKRAATGRLLPFDGTVARLAKHLTSGASF